MRTHHGTPFHAHHLEGPPANEEVNRHEIARRALETLNELVLSLEGQLLLRKEGSGEYRWDDAHEGGLRRRQTPCRPSPQGKDAREGLVEARTRKQPLVRPVVSDILSGSPSGAWESGTDLSEEVALLDRVESLYIVPLLGL